MPSAPTSPPTSEATATVEVSLTLAAAAPPSPSEEAGLKTSIASSVGVDEASVRNFIVTATASRRLTGGRGWAADASPRRLAYTWAVSFDVVADVAAVGAASPQAFEATVATQLAAPAFAAAVQSVAPSATVAAVATVLATRHPSPLPSPAFSLLPTPDPSLRPSAAPPPSGNTGTGGLSTGALGMALAGMAGLALVCLVCVVVKNRSASNVEGKAEVLEKAAASTPEDSDDPGSPIKNAYVKRTSAYGQPSASSVSSTSRRLSERESKSITL